MKLAWSSASLLLCVAPLFAFGCSKKGPECDALNGVYSKTTHAEARNKIAAVADAENAVKIVEAEVADIAKLTITDEKLKGFVASSNALDAKFIAQYKAHAAALKGGDEAAVTASATALKGLEAEEKKFDGEFDGYCK